MKSPFALVCLCLFSLTLTSCSKEDITTDVQFLEASYFGNCFYYSGENPKSIVIRDQDTYENYFAGLRQSAVNKDCSNALPTPIDFDKYTLIGHWTSGGGCTVSYDRNVIQQGNKEVIYSVSTVYSGGCAMYIFNMNWALIPKIKNRTDVVFNIEEVYDTE